MRSSVVSAAAGRCRWPSANRSRSRKASRYAAIVAGLEQIQGEIEAGAFPFSAALEDIHMNIEARLTELIGEPGRKLHTARSRNDQVATDLRLWVRDAIDQTDRLLKDLRFHWSI